jgi:hypothetical protein
MIIVVTHHQVVQDVMMETKVGIPVKIHSRENQKRKEGRFDYGIL